jgi:hemoglobin
MYERVGGAAWFVELVARFYAGVERSVVLRPMYPADLGPSRERLAGFLVQYWGGPGTYSEQRGHPRLRLRHAPFPIDEAARDEWLRLMTDAVLAGGLPDAARDEMLAYFADASAMLVNRRADGLDLVGREPPG